jgi:hypothetical protein
MRKFEDLKLIEQIKVKDYINEKFVCKTTETFSRNAYAELTSNSLEIKSIRSSQDNPISVEIVYFFCTECNQTVRRVDLIEHVCIHCSIE